jgi:short-subunit dehydrogenase
LASPLTPHKTALITGASSGIGKALAYHFAQDGYQLVLAARGVARMQALADALQEQFKVVVTVIGADLETNDGAAQLHADIKARGIVLSALVNNAGYGAFGEFKDSALDAGVGHDAAQHEHGCRADQALHARSCWQRAARF